MTPEPEQSRPDLLVAATLYLMTHYMRTGCPRLALCVARHMQCLALHADADPKVRDICSALHGVWGEAAGAAQDQSAGPVPSPDPSLMH